jgi:hypothetical protein
MLVQEYYQVLQKGILCCGVLKENEDKMVSFYGGGGGLTGPFVT